MANVLQDYAKMKQKQAAPQGGNPLLQAFHNFGQGIDNFGNSLYQGVRNATMGFDQFLGLPDSRLPNPQLLNPLAAQTPYGAGNQPTVTPASIQPTPTVPAGLTQLTKQIADGFTKYGRPQAAQYAPYFAQAGQGLPDPYMPATLSLKETSGGKNLYHQNNWLNIGPEIDYPDVPSNIVGGNGKKGFAGVIKNGLYDKYLKSGDLNDFFSVYTPHTYNNADGSTGYNGAYPDQIKQYNQLRSYFTGH